MQRWTRIGTIALSLAGALLALAHLLAGAPVLVLPVGPFVLAVDGLSSFFLLILLLTAAATAAGPVPASPLAAAGLVLALLAGDGFILVLGIAAASARSRRILAVLGLVLALVLLAHGFADMRFAALRAHAPDGVRAAAILLLTLLATTWLPGAAYLLLRVVFDLCGPAQPAWWSLPLLLLGAGLALRGAIAANLRDDFAAVVAQLRRAQAGLILIAAGIALAARAADLGALTALALAASLVLALASAFACTLLGIAGDAIRQGAGSTHLDRLGGLVRSMPLTTACALAATASLAALPPTAGFAGGWLLFQAAFLAPRTGNLAFQILIAGAVAVTGLAIALVATAAIRLAGLACLGRPRTPRASAAEDPARATGVALVALAGLGALAGLFPGAVLTLAGPALRGLAGTAMSDRLTALAVMAQGDAPGYAAPAIMLLLGVCGAGAVLLLRRYAPAGQRTGPAWEDGFDPPPSWMPFGDPVTQITAAGFSGQIRRLAGRAPADLRGRAARFILNPRAEAQAVLAALMPRQIAMIAGCAVIALLTILAVVSP